MAFEQTRDLRSAAQASKRFKEQKAKWSLGARPSAGVYRFWNSDKLTGSASQQAKVRPEKRLYNHHEHQSSNIVKPRTGRIAHDVPQSHSRAKCDALAELKDPSNISRSIHDFLPSPDHRRLDVSDNFLYSFDRTDTPGGPLSLDIFVKTNPRATEKLVEKEYEILDANGDALKGRKARRDLRRKSPQPVAEEARIVEEDGFELI
ncbi:hypothetical protein DL769_005808 [Monosporascus sp. CRB-8-3]|nr:hypothetical protein DL769_005808 [Monosporascus sp. CRB-8-3]